jgi:pyruvate,orthophosphate dikinase
MGTAVTVQEMVYGNMGDDCATGVAFTRNPSTGENKRYGEFLPNAQGEDVVAGVRTPLQINEMAKTFPDATKKLFDIFTKLEDHYGDMQDIEFTIERNKLFILQTRNGKRTAAAAVKIAVDMVEEGRIKKPVALMRLEPSKIETLLHKQLDSNAIKKATAIASGLPASPGAAVGQIVFSADAAVDWKEKGKKVVLVRLETSPEDITGMHASQGILTARGGMTSHAAVVARGMNVPCVAGCSDIRVNEKAKLLHVGGKDYPEGAWISLDGNTGKVYAGQIPVQDAQLDDNFHKIIQWCKEHSSLVVRANADTPHDAAVSLKFGAQGVGLCRTEHMFFCR